MHPTHRAILDAMQRAHDAEQQRLARDVEVVQSGDVGLPDYVSKWLAQQKGTP